MILQEFVMATIEQQYLPPPDYETTIAEADRPRIYDAVRKQLGDLLEGNQSYYPDGVQKDWQARADDLDRYIKSFMSSQGASMIRRISSEMWSGISAHTPNTSATE
jgi:hypothetical protein